MRSSSIVNTYRRLHPQSIDFAETASDMAKISFAGVSIRRPDFVRWVRPALSKNSNISIVKLRPTPDLSRYAPGLNVLHSDCIAKFSAISARIKVAAGVK